MKEAPLLKVQCTTCKKNIYIIDTEEILKIPKDIKPGELFPLRCRFWCEGMVAVFVENVTERDLLNNKE